MTLDALPAALADLGLDVMPVRLLGGSLYTPDGRHLRPLHPIEEAGYRLFYVGPGRCTSRKREDGGKSWRCDQTTGHDGDHRSTSGHRSWPQLTSTHPTQETTTHA